MMASEEVQILRREIDRLERVIEKLMDSLGPAAQDVLADAEQGVDEEMEREG